ncbi:MAG: Cupin domain protein [Candidatus Moranbacteria bacterium GW2011_GWF2_34_56]|nr:MAG: Cupin domain protein [Candidatus Moranbacteria bacterium GW2011_GWF1_34_10]KKP64872.1 MAG: Cupin domain protein [Candidatus Moranbacteria bacterium GW2011_GWF2_34_56]HBI16580.1 cupin domain-containing protein [Candidatus Moranbacteria bacterium]
MYEKIMDRISYSDGGILSKEIIKKDNLNVTLMSMAQGTELSEHTSTRQGTVYVVEGKGVFNLEGEDIKMEPGVLIYMKANMRHSLIAEENTSFILSLVE